MDEGKLNKLGSFLQWSPSADIQKRVPMTKGQLNDFSQMEHACSLQRPNPETEKMTDITHHLSGVSTALISNSFG